MTSRVLLALAGLLVFAGGASAQKADWILHGGRIHTLANDEASTVSAIAIADGAVVAVGSLEDVAAFADASTRSIDLEGRVVLPGLVDAHLHLRGIGDRLGRVRLRGTTSAQDCVERAREIEAGLPEGAWLRGRGWDQNDWEDTAFPTRDVLDAAFPDRPVVFGRVDGHAIWVNSRALELAGIEDATADPAGGEIVRDGKGRATGVFVDAAKDLVYAVIPSPTEAQIERSYRLAIDEAHRFGITGVHDMGAKRQEIEILRRAEREGWLDLRVVSYLGGAKVLAEWPDGPWRPDARALLRVEGVKLYADGALGSRGAALLEDYSDRPGHRGFLIEEPEVLTAQMRDAMARGFQVVVHAIGDRGNRVVIDGMVAAHESLDLAPLVALRPRIEHAQIVHPDDLPRFAKLGIIPSMQPTHCTSDMPWAPERLGEARLEGAYAWRTLLESGSFLPLGSDAPVEKVSPWLGLYAAVTRQDPQGHPPGGWSPDQRLTRLEALLGFTTWPARAIGLEDVWGRLDVGYRADLVVVDDDPLSEAPKRLLDTEAVATMVEGEWVFTQADFSVR